MGLFRNDLSSEMKSLCAEIANAYVERAELGAQLFLMRPLPTVSEVAALWALIFEHMSEQRSAPKVPLGSDADESPKDFLEDELAVLDSMTRTFFDSFCQSFLKIFLKSDFQLRFDSQEIKSSVGPILKQMSKERAEQLGVVLWGAAANAMKLARGTMQIVKMRLTAKQADAASRYAVSTIRSRSELPPILMAEAEDRLSLAARDWASAS
jgi:hypothetical protein